MSWLIVPACQGRDRTAEGPGLPERMGERRSSCRLFLACAIALACHPRTAVTDDEHQPLEFASNLNHSQIVKSQLELKRQFACAHPLTLCDFNSISTFRQISFDHSLTSEDRDKSAWAFKHTTSPFLGQELFPAQFWPRAWIAIASAPPNRKPPDTPRRHLPPQKENTEKYVAQSP